jgi:hypothetical protein
VKKKRKKKNGHGIILVICSILIVYLIAGYWKKFREMEVAQSTDITFEEEQKPAEKVKKKREPEVADGIPRLRWKDLQGLDHLTGKMSAQIKKHNQQTVKIPGYIVPLTDDLESFNEFLIVPNPQACIHFPPPPPNQMLYVKTKKNLPISITYYPFWFQGKLEAVSTYNEFGKVSYKLTLQRLESYR